MNLLMMMMMMMIMMMMMMMMMTMMMKMFQVSSFKFYCRISLYNTFFNLHCSQLAIASRGEQWLDVYTRENK